MEVLQTNSFRKSVKKLYPKQKKILDTSVREIIANPLIGTQKHGRISHIRVYKFSMNKQLVLLAYVYDQAVPAIMLYALGSHENFYKNLENK